MDVGIRRHVAPDGGGQVGLVVTPQQLPHLHLTHHIFLTTFSALQHSNATLTTQQYTDKTYPVFK